MSHSRNSGRLTRLFVVALATFLLAACGSTKIITAQKSLAYRGSIYQMTDVSAVSSKLEATTGDGNVIDVSRYDKRQAQQLLDEQNSIGLRSAILLDEREVLYEQKTVNSYRDFAKLQKDMQNALKDIQKFIADPKKTQLEL